MKIGIVYPQLEFGNDPGLIKEFAQTAEGLGYNHVFAYEHVLGANPDRPEGWDKPFTHEHPFHEPFVLYSFMAAVTEKLEFITGILILPQRQTALVAKQAATLDVLSQGRLRLGIGLGWNNVEYESLNQDFHTRGRRLEEQVMLLRELWTSPLVQFSGQWHSIPDAGLNPLPIQQPIPIWFGGHADIVLRRIARMGNGWLPEYATASETQESLEKLDQYLKDEGRTLADIGIEPRLAFGEGDPETWDMRIEEWKEAGATHITLLTLGYGFDKPQDHLHAMQTFANNVTLN